MQDVTDEIIESISAVYHENPPAFIYFITLYNIFREFLDDLSEDYLPNEKTGFNESLIWKMLYPFQWDAALAIINKLERYNGCILADSVGLGKTFTALAVIKYYENRNKSVLVLCPKKLQDNWNTFKGNYINNPIALDRLNYHVLFHTDLSREEGYSNGIDLNRLNWGNFDLVVIDESHNFRNGGAMGGAGGDKENRYLRLLNKVIKAGVKTKVLMLSATPVNNRFFDLYNQLKLAYEGDPEIINEKLNLKKDRDIEYIFRQAQIAFNTWSKKEPNERTTENLLRELSFDFFVVLDSVTIARSRKHIEKYYNAGNLCFPQRNKPITERPFLTTLEGAVNYNEIYEQLESLNVPAVYARAVCQQQNRTFGSRIYRPVMCSTSVLYYIFIFLFGFFKFYTHVIYLINGFIFTQISSPFCIVEIITLYYTYKTLRIYFTESFY
jgi:SNF2 family DNA or RNA helicase